MYTIVPRIGPSIVPSPPMITANAMYAVHCTLNTALGWMISWLTASSAPAAPHPTPATTKTSIRATPTRAPELRAATSSSLTAVSTRPSLLRSSRYTPSRASTVTASPIQYVYASSTAELRLGVCGSDSPVPPPMEGNFWMISETVVASTQVAIAKYPLRSRATSHHIGTAATPQPMAAIGSAVNIDRLWMFRISTKYAPSPTNACCPTDTRPAYPASRFHMLARVKMMNACTRMVSVPAPTRYGNSASTTTTTRAPSPVQATFLRDRVTRYFSAERAVVSATAVTTPPSGLSGPAGAGPARPGRRCTRPGTRPTR